MSDARSDAMPKAYEPAAIEDRWYTFWEESGFFKPGDDDARPRFCIVIPPPNVTGSLHMGHAFNNTLHDILVRWKRMKGHNTLWLPGCDHAGIATQNVVEKALRQEGTSRQALGREAFVARVWQWKEEYGGRIINQLRKLGTSCDWTRTRFTLDEGLSKAVREVFVRLYEEGLIYKGEYIVNWCPRCGTAISDLETIYETLDAKLYYIRYPLWDGSGHITVATTRPETMLGDTAVAVNPGDERFTHLHGKSLRLPVIGRELPIITDDHVEKEFGTGLVKVTPSHDPNDFEMGRAHDLPFVQVIDEHGRMTEAAGPYAGQDRFECREKLLDQLRGEGLLENVTAHVHNVGHCQRCATVIEPLVSSQWFVKVAPLAEQAVEAVRQGRTRFFPDRFEKTYFNWMGNIHDWCISRQLWWGHRIPAWRCGACGEFTVARQDPAACAHCGAAGLRQEEDVLDTWFSSALWPFSTLGWPERTEDLRRFYPTDLLITGFDIIFFWVARMMMMGVKFMEDVPFRTVYIHGLVRDEHNQKMSKSKGNAIDPLEIMEQYGTDAVRFTLTIMAMPGNDLPFKLDRMVGYRAFANKIWNAARFLLMKLPADLPPVEEDDIRTILERDGDVLRLYDRWILHRYQAVAGAVDRALEEFLYHEAADAIYHFFWHEFCDWYIELAKAPLAGDDARRRQAVARILLFVLERSLRLLHPIMPFITEEIWQRLPHRGPSVMVAPFPEATPAFAAPETVPEMEFFQDIVTALRNLRSENNLQPGARFPAGFLPPDADSARRLKEFAEEIRLLAGLREVVLRDEPPAQPGLLKGLCRGVAVDLHPGALADPESEKTRLTKEIRKLEEELARLESKMNNPEFLAKAPAAVVEKNRVKHEEILGKLAGHRAALDGLGAEA
jgi:valyl-tRNA synthetase